MKTRSILAALALAAAVAAGGFTAPAAVASAPVPLGPDNFHNDLAAAHVRHQPAAATGRTAAVKPALQVQPTTYATAGTPTNTNYCVSVSGADACFQPYGDLIWVRDTASDGHPAYADWENDLWSGSAWIAAYASTCESTLGAGRWGYCDEEFFEDSQANNVGGVGSVVGVWARTYNAVLGPLVVTNNG